MSFITWWTINIQTQNVFALTDVSPQLASSVVLPVSHIESVFSPNSRLKSGLSRSKLYHKICVVSSSAFVIRDDNQTSTILAAISSVDRNELRHSNKKCNIQGSPISVRHRVLFNMKPFPPIGCFTFWHTKWHFKQRKYTTVLWNLFCCYLYVYCAMTSDVDMTFFMLPFL